MKKFIEFSRYIYGIWVVCLIAFLVMLFDERRFDFLNIPFIVFALFAILSIAAAACCLIRFLMDIYLVFVTKSISGMGRKMLELISYSALVYGISYFQGPKTSFRSLMIYAVIIIIAAAGIGEFFGRKQYQKLRKEYISNREGE